MKRLPRWTFSIWWCLNGWCLNFRPHILQGNDDLSPREWINGCCLPDGCFDDFGRGWWCGGNSWVKITRKDALPPWCERLWYSLPDLVRNCFPHWLQINTRPKWLFAMCSLSETRWAFFFPQYLHVMPFEFPRLLNAFNPSRKSFLFPSLFPSAEPRVDFDDAEFSASHCRKNDYEMDTFNSYT